MLTLQRFDAVIGVVIVMNSLSIGIESSITLKVEAGDSPASDLDTFVVTEPDRRLEACFYGEAPCPLICNHFLNRVAFLPSPRTP